MLLFVGQDMSKVIYNPSNDIKRTFKAIIEKIFQEFYIATDFKELTKKTIERIEGETQYKHKIYFQILDKIKGKYINYGEIGSNSIDESDINFKRALEICENILNE